MSSLLVLSRRQNRRLQKLVQRCSQARPSRIAVSIRAYRHANRRLGRSSRDQTDPGASHAAGRGRDARVQTLSVRTAAP